jgi:alkylhydroperoxidase family enzyme
MSGGAANGTAHSWIPRLEQEAMAPALAEYLTPRVKRLGYLGEMFKVSANAPGVLLSFLHFTDALKDALPFDIGEAVVLTVATWMDNAYERHQHERLCLRSGMTAPWLREVRQCEPGSAHLMTPVQCAAQRYALAALRTRGLDAHAEFGALAAHFTPDQAMALVFLVGRYVTHALVVSTLALRPPVPSVFEDGFTG